MGWIVGLIVVMIPLGAGAVAGLLAKRARQGPRAWAVGMGVAGLVSLVTIIGHAFVDRDLALWPTTPSEYQDIFTISTDGSGLRKLTRIPGRYDDPAWSPDGSNIVFVSMQEGARLKSAMAKVGTFLAYLFFAICGPTALWLGVKSWRRHGANRVTILCVISSAIPTLITILLLWAFLVPA